MMKQSESVSLSRETNQNDSEDLATNATVAGTSAMDTMPIILEEEAKSRITTRSMPLESEQFFTPSLNGTNSPIVTSRPYKLAISSPATPGSSSSFKHPVTPTFASPALHLQPGYNSKASNQSGSANSSMGIKAEGGNKNSFSNASFLLRTPGNTNSGQAGLRLISGAGRGLSRTPAQSSSSQPSSDQTNSSSHSILIATMIQPGFSRPSSGVSTPAVLPSPGLHALSATSGPNDFHTLAPSPAIDLNNFGSQGFNSVANGSSSSQVSHRKRRTPPSQMTPTLGIHASPRMTLATPSVETLTFPAMGESSTLASRLNSPQPHQLSTLRPPQKLPQPQPIDSTPSDFLQVSSAILSQTGPIGYPTEDNKVLTSSISESYFPSGRVSLKSHNLNGDLKSGHYISSNDQQVKEELRLHERHKIHIPQTVELDDRQPAALHLTGDGMETTESFSLGFQAESTGGISNTKILTHNFPSTTSKVDPVGSDSENLRLSSIQNMPNQNGVLFRQQIFDSSTTDQAVNSIATRLKSRGGTLMLHSMPAEKIEIVGERALLGENIMLPSNGSDAKDNTLNEPSSLGYTEDAHNSKKLNVGIRRLPINVVPKQLHPTQYGDVYQSIYSHEDFESVSKRLIAEKTVLKMQKEARRQEMRQKLQTKQMTSSSSSSKSNRGLRHFSLKVCETVRRLGVTSYNHVADTLVEDLAEQNERSGDGQNNDDEGEEDDEEADNSDSEQTKVKSKKAPASAASDPKNKNKSKAYYEKNIRRRVYDALNVLMALGTIEKCKKQICWRAPKTSSLRDIGGLPNEDPSQAALPVAVEFGYARDLEDLRLGLHMAQEKLKRKVNLARTMMRNYIGLKSLIDRNRVSESGASKSSKPTDGKLNVQNNVSAPRINLPFVIVSCSNGVEGQVDYLNDHRSSALLMFSEQPKLEKDIDIIGTLAQTQFPFSSGLSRNNKISPVHVSTAQLRYFTSERNDISLGLTRPHSKLDDSEEITRKYIKIEGETRDVDDARNILQDDFKHIDENEDEDELSGQIRWRLPGFDSLGLPEDLEVLANSIYRDTQRAMTEALNGSSNDADRLDFVLDDSETEFVPLTTYQEGEEDEDVDFEDIVPLEDNDNETNPQVSTSYESDGNTAPRLTGAQQKSRGKKLEKVADTAPQHPMRTRSSEIAQVETIQPVVQDMSFHDSKTDDDYQSSARDYSQQDTGFYPYASSRTNYYQNIPQSTLYQPQSPLDRITKFAPANLPVTLHYQGRGDPRLRSPQSIGSSLSSTLSPVKLNHYNQHAANAPHSQRQNNVLFASVSRTAGSSHTSSSVATPTAHFSGQTPIGSGSSVGAPMQIRRYDRDSAPGASRSLLGASPNRNGAFIPTPGSSWNRPSTSSTAQTRGASSSRAHLPHSSFTQFDSQQISTPIHLRQPHALVTPDNIGGVMRRANPTPSHTIHPFQQPSTMTGMNSSDLLSSAINAAAGASLNAVSTTTTGRDVSNGSSSQQDANISSQSTVHKTLAALLQPSTTLSSFDPRIRAGLHGLPLDVQEALKDIQHSSNNSKTQ